MSLHMMPQSQPEGLFLMVPYYPFPYAGPAHMGQVPMIPFPGLVPTGGHTHIGPVAGPAHMGPVTGPSHMAPTGGPTYLGPVAGSAHIEPSAEFGHAASTHDWGTHALLTGMNGVEPYQVYGDHISQEHLTN